MTNNRFPQGLKQIFEDDDVIAYKPLDDLWLLHTKRGVSVSFYILEGSDKTLIIDSGHQIKNFKRIIDKITQKPYMLAITHGHPDHVGSINEFDKIYMNKKDENLIPFYKGTIENISQGFVFDLGNRYVEVIDMPGHTEGSIGFLDQNGKYLLVGDSIGYITCWMHLSDLPLECLIITLKYLQSIKEKWNEIYTGHYHIQKKPLKHQYVDDLLELATKICYSNDCKSEPWFGEGFTFDFQPLVSYGKNGINIAYNPNNLLLKKQD